MGRNKKSSNENHISTIVLITAILNLLKVVAEIIYKHLE